jgi:site-specific recombinase XerD
METELADFLHYCRVERRLAELTCTAYERDVRAYMRFLQRGRGDGLLSCRLPRGRVQLDLQRSSYMS